MQLAAISGDVTFDPWPLEKTLSPLEDITFRHRWLCAFGRYRSHPRLVFLDIEEIVSEQRFGGRNLQNKVKKYCTGSCSLRRLPVVPAQEIN